MQGGHLALQPQTKAEAGDTFTLVPLQGGEVALKSKLNGKFVMVDQSTNGPAQPNYQLRAGSDTAGPWEKFTVERPDRNSLVLKSSSTGKYVGRTPPRHAPPPGGPGGLPGRTRACPAGECAAVNAGVAPGACTAAAGMDPVPQRLGV